MKIEFECKGIQNLEVKAKIEEVKEKGEVIDTYPVTTVKFEIRGTPGQFDDLLTAISAGLPVNAAFGSPQLKFDNVLDEAISK
jgi:hypothetical protein